MKRRMTHNGRKVEFVRIEAGDEYIQHRRKLDRFDVCPLCKAEFDSAIGAIWVLHSVEAGVPNRILHEACLKGKTPKEGFQLIAADWEEAKRHAHWFDLPGREIPY